MIGFMDLSNIFNNRELALLTWMALALLYVFLQRDNNLRASLFKVISCLFQPVLLIAASLVLIWTSIGILLLYKINAWSILNLKTSIIWFVTFGLFSLKLASDPIENRAIFSKKVLLESLNLTVIITFITEAYDFSFVIELVLIPIGLLLGASNQITKSKAELLPAHNLIGAILVILGLAYIGNGLIGLFSNPKDFFVRNNILEFLIPAFLTIWYIPFMLMFNSFEAWKGFYSRLKFTGVPENLHFYTAIKSFFAFNGNSELLQRFNSELFKSNPINKQEITGAIELLVRTKRNEKEAFAKPTNGGWGASAARYYLKDINLVTNPYRKSYDDEWVAFSTMLEVAEKNYFSSTVAYYLTGDEYSVRSLKLKLNANINSDVRFAEEKFKEFCELLYEAAMSHMKEYLQERWGSGEGFMFEIDGVEVKLTYEPLLNENTTIYSKIFTLNYVGYKTHP